MTTEMKQLLALLLLGCCVLAVQGERGGKKDICTQGWAAGEAFFEYRRCSRPKPHTMVRNLRDSFYQNATVDNLQILLTNYCSTVLPKMVRCFEDYITIKNCTDQQQQSLRTLMQRTGFICQANTTSVNPMIRRILTNLTSNDLSRPCFPEMLQRNCSRKPLEAFNVSSNRELNAYLRNVTLQQQPQTAQKFFGSLMECGASLARANSGSCPSWRRGVLEVFMRFTMPAILGLNMTYEEEDINRMFGWNGSAQIRAVGDQYQGNLFNWLQ